MKVKTIPAVTMWVNGKAASSTGNRFGNVCNPATGSVIRNVPFATAQDVDAAVNAATAALPGWQAVTPLNRARILDRFRELLHQNREPLARLISEEHGKTVSDALGSIQRGLEVVEFATGAPHLLKGEWAENVGRGVDCHSTLQPLGVCAGITPFNFPAMVPLWMFPMAIVCGNTFLLKPSEKVPSASIMMADLLKQSGLPDGVFNVIHGDKEAVDALLLHPAIRAISFVGTTRVAQYVYLTATSQGKRVQALGGAKNHAVVLPDADLEFTADALIGAGFGSSGQRCMAISAVLAVGDTADRLVDVLKRKAEALRLGAGDAPGVEMGPVITAEQRDRIKSYIDAGIAQGATPVLDGRRAEVPPQCERGFFVGPTILDHVQPDMTIYRDEVFGPVLVVLRASSLEEAITLINRNPYGNSAAIFTRSGGAARRFQDQVEAGMVGINVPLPVPMAFFSFGGWKSSLFGDLHMHGIEGVYFYTRRKVITERWTDTDVTASQSPSLNMPTM
jgi:malonate-semialdehyde dehydrogenase (acetylating)/methylmalonate-semialdehyde dehydrogenase